MLRIKRSFYRLSQTIIDIFQTSQTAGQPEIIKLVVKSTIHSTRSATDL